ncbi:MAG TPA: formylglycine-generating enzyme family protein [Puia sp.]|nr:formylglycine-generating enzyme family protein [Puia sp.]
MKPALISLMFLLLPPTTPWTQNRSLSPSAQNGSPNRLNAQNRSLNRPTAQNRSPHRPWASKQDHPGMILIPGGVFQPFLLASGRKQKEHIPSFFLDEHAVTNADFLEFVRANPRWRRSKVARVFADSHYLAQWSGDLDIGNGQIRNSPVTDISWFAADAYCRWKGKRLPTLAEWEYAAGALPLNAKRGQNLSRIILSWYDHPAPAILPPVESTYKNKFGVWDMHGLIWEWVDDFNSVMLKGGNFYCAAGSAGTADKEDYAAYMRYAFRESIQANYAVRSLGFRCARDID